MQPNIKNFADIERLIKEHPKEADALAFKWQAFVKKYPDALSFETQEEFSVWAAKRGIDASIWIGKEIPDVYFYLRHRNETLQQQTQGGITPSNAPVELLNLQYLSAAFQERPKILEEDQDYQKIIQEYKKLWRKNNPGKDFTRKEGLDYIFGSLDNDSLPTLKKDAEQLFRNRYPKKAAMYDKEKTKVYKNPNDDPAVINLKKTIEEHIKARRQYLEASAEIEDLIQKKSVEKFIKEYPQKVAAYWRKKEKEEDEEEKRKRRKKLAEEIIKKWLREELKKRYKPIKLKLNEIAKNIGRRINDIAIRSYRIGARLASQGAKAATQSGIRIAGTVIRITIQAGMRIAIQVGMIGARLIGTAAAGLTSNPIGWIIIAVIAAIVIIVFLIIMFAGSGGSFVAGRLYECSPSVNLGVPTDYATSPANCSSGPDVDCVIDLDGNTGLVADGNTCAQKAAEYYSKEENQTITAKCIDKCTDLALTKICSPDVNNNCPDPNLTCQGSEETPISGAGNKTFCIEYTIQTPTPTP